MFDLKDPMPLKRSIPVKHVSKEGLLMDSKGKLIYDDSWLHPEVLDHDWDKSHNRGLKATLRKSVLLYVDLEKGRIDTSKLVKKPVQVHGENGKIFTRMQWVDPNTGQPVSQKSAIDQHVKAMSTEEKYDMLDKHKIQWKHNDHPNILHKNKVEALKNHLYNNPHLVGVEHLPKEEENKTPTGTDRINEWTNRLSKHDRSKLYSMMAKFGIAEEDPVIANPEDKAAPIKHMHNMMKLKKHLQDNPHYMDDPEFQPQQKPKSSSSAQTTAEKGGNTIDGVLKTMSRSEIYELMKKHNIADQDPLEANPEDKAAPIKHMHNMMRLKKLIEMDPSILNRGPGLSLKKHEEERRAGMDDNQKASQEVKDLLNTMSPDLKSKIADQYADHPFMQSRIRSEHAHVDNMHKISALRKILESNPNLVEKHKKEAEKEQLMGLTIGNKNMGKVLRHFIGLKGVGDVKNVEPGIEWSFETGFVRRERDDNDNPILSVVDTGKDGEDWNEYTIDLSEVKDFLQNKKDDTIKSLSDYDIINWRW